MWIPCILLLGMNCSVYFLSRLVTASFYHYRLDNRLDNLIPFVPAFVSIYFLCYLVWVWYFRLAMIRQSPEAYRFLGAELLIKLIALAIFILLPTTNTRPEIVGNGIWEQLMRYLYSIDPADNLFPSLHCINSWLCVIAVRGHKEVSKGCKIFSIAAAFAVFASVLFTKQHVIVDILGGVALAEAGYYFAEKIGFTKWYIKFVGKLNHIFKIQ